MIASDLLLGIGAAATSAACYDVAVALQALDAREVPVGHGLRLSLLRRLIVRRRWLGATLLSAAGWPFQVAALSLAPLTVVQPTLALGLVLLLVLGTRILGERVGRREIAGTAAIVLGVAAIAIAAPAHSEAHGDTVVLAVALGLIGLLALAPYAIPRQRTRGGMLLVVGAGAAYAWTAFSSQLLAEDISRARWVPAAAWVLGTGAVAGAGFLSEMTSLQRRPATQVAPVIFVVQSVVPVVLAPLLSDERWGSTPLGGGMIAMALVVVAAGAVLLGSSPMVGGLVGAEAAASEKA